MRLRGAVKPPTFALPFVAHTRHAWLARLTRARGKSSQREGNALFDDFWYFWSLKSTTKEKLLYETLDNCRDELHFAKENASLAGKTVSEASYSAQKEEKLKKMSTAVSEYENAEITIDEALSRCGVIYEIYVTGDVISVDGADQT